MTDYETGRELCKKAGEPAPKPFARARDGLSIVHRVRQGQQKRASHGGHTRQTTGETVGECWACSGSAAAGERGQHYCAGFYNPAPAKPRDETLDESGILGTDESRAGSSPHPREHMPDGLSS